MAKAKKVTKQEETRGYGESGFDLVRMTVEFFVAVPKSKWIALISELPFEVEEKVARGVVPPVRLSLVTVPWTPRSPMLYVDAHDCGNKNKQGEKESHWTISWRRSPSREPPTKLIARSKAFGPLERAIEILSQKWPSSSPIEYEVDARYNATPKRNPLVDGIAKSKPSPITLEGKPKRYLIPYSVGWYLSDGTNHSQITIRYPIDENPHYVNWSGTIKERFVPNLLHVLDSKICQQLLQIAPPR